MDHNRTGALIRSLRLERGMTQRGLAERMNISDKTVSKWERGLGCPDVSLLPELSRILGVGLEHLLSGALEENDLVGGNMKKLRCYVCPGCGIVYGDPPGASAWKRILDIGAVFCVLILVSAFALWAAGLLIL